eukprot:125246-Prymnesium_polylepis.1
MSVSEVSGAPYRTDCHYSNASEITPKKKLLLLLLLLLHPDPNQSWTYQTTSSSTQGSSMSKAEASKDGETTGKPHPRRSSCRAYSRRCSNMESQSAICESRTPDAGAVAASVSAFH